MIKQNSLMKKKIPWIEIAFIMLYSVYYILPAASDMVHFIVPIMIAFLYFGYLFFRDTHITPKIVLYVVIICLIALIYILLTDTITISEPIKLKEFLSKFNQYFCMCLPILFLFRVVWRAGSLQKKSILVFCLGIVTYVIVLTLQELAINPNAIRQWEMFEELKDDNIGNYYFVYSIPILVVAISVCLSQFNKWQKIIAFGVMAFLFLFLVKAQYTLAILITIIGLLIQFFLSIKNHFLKAMFLLAATVGVFFIPNILFLAYTYIPSEQVATRLKELYDFFVEGNASGYNLNGRLTLYIKTIVAFFKSPIIGNRRLPFDGHATCLTVLADTGIIGGTLFYTLLALAFKDTKKVLSEEGKHLLPIFICLLLMGFTNPIHNSMPLAFMHWFIAPLLIHVVYESKKK